jgi:glutamate dehydrogenase (NAD(P)+)
MEYQNASQAVALQTIEEKLRVNTAQVLAESHKHKILPREAAVNLATERVKRAMTFRRWSTF